MRMKVLLLSALMCVPVLAWAGPGGQGQGQGKKQSHLDKMAKDLDLTAEQRRSIKGVMSEAKGKCGPMENKKEHKECWKGQKDEVHTKITALLNEDQRVRYEEQRRLKQENWKSGKGKGMNQKGGKQMGDKAPL